ncbi:MAG: hypothetical protein DMF88_25155 [Acidobacteria bacterium]|nr:MAG: hypothetical protein DMF88_25155 [Acidobacteriota bacterium]
MKAGLCLAALFVSTAAFAQSSSPGPYIVDVRGAMSGAPGGASFYPIPLISVSRVSAAAPI